MVEPLSAKHVSRLLARHTCRLLGTAALLVCGPFAAEALTPAEELRQAFAEVNRILVDPRLDGKLDERLVAIRQVVRRLFDFDEAAQAALGEQWRLRSVRERHEFVQLFTAFLERAYLSRVAAGISFDGEDTVTYVDELVEGDRALVQTTMRSRLRGPLEFDYRMAGRGERWVITDVIANGVSLIANYQAQFSRVILTSSYADL